MEDNPGLKYIFFGGKGRRGKDRNGRRCRPLVGQEGKRTLLASTNPVHSLSNLFGQDVFGKPVVVCNEDGAMLSRSIPGTPSSGPSRRSARR